MDVEFIDHTIDFMLEFTYKPFMTLKNVTANFGDYFELSQLISTDIMLKRKKVPYQHYPYHFESGEITDGY